MNPIRVVYCTTILTICSLYAAQPIQPVFQQEFALSDFQAILFTTFMLAPLGIAPMVYGFFLEIFPIKKILRISILLMGILEILFVSSSNYYTLLIIRCAQGLVIPAILTSLMSYVSYISPKEKVQQAIALYVGATTLGGFGGRLLSGLLTDFLGWRFFFLVLGIGFFGIYFLLNKLSDDVQPRYVKPSPSVICSLLKKPQFYWLYICIFTVFFVFSAIMNFLPFRLVEISPSSGASGIGMLYLGYAMGITVSIVNKRIREFFHKEWRAIAVGLILFFIGTLFFISTSYIMLFVGMFIFCTGMFGAHTLLSGYLNILGNNNKAVANGLYISFYYAGGTFGSFMPSFVLNEYSWNIFIVILCFFICFAFFCNLQLKAAVESVRIKRDS